MNWVIDMDGVIWRGGEPIKGSIEALQELREAGARLHFVTNNSAMTRVGYVEKMQALGFVAEPEEILHAGFAVATLVKPGQRVLSCAREGVSEALELAGVEYAMADDVDEFNPAGFDAVVIGGYRGQTLERLAVAMRAVMLGARLVAPSGDPRYPSDEGAYLGGGAMTQAVAYAAGTEAEFAGKPYPPMTSLVTAQCGEVTGVVGDQVKVDGGLAEALGCRFIWVQSGVGKANSDYQVESDIAVEIVEDLQAAVPLMLDKTW